MSSIDDIPIEPERPKKETGRLALMVSIIALIVSALSLWDSHGIANLANVQIAEAAPRLYVRHAELRRFDQEPHDFTLFMDVKNEGNLSVAVKDITVQPNISLLPGDEARKPCYDDLKKTIFKGDGMEEKVDAQKFALISVYIPIPASCTDTGWRFFADVKFRGHDQVGAPYQGSDGLVRRRN